MLTPVFELSQDDTFLYIIIKTPFAKVSETEIFIEEDEFKFYSKPYYLRLNLPGNIVEDGRESAKYDANMGNFNIKIPKEVHGQFFDGLDMLTKLLAPKGKSTVPKPLIEVLSSEETSSGNVSDDLEFELETFDWQIGQDVCSGEDALALVGPKYGFANQKAGVFKQLKSELHDVIDLKDPDTVKIHERSKLRQEDEQTLFDDDHYLADLFQDDHIQEILKFQPDYTFPDSQNLPEQTDFFSQSEKAKMTQLPRNEYLLDKHEHVTAMLGLVDIIFAYAYNHRTTEGENTVESVWTVVKLSSTLSWFDTFSNVNDVVISSLRRSLIYPLYRNWNLSCFVLKDTCDIFTHGRSQVLKCLLEIHSFLSKSEQFYILNDLYITDYCVWVQSVTEEHFRSIGKSLSGLKIQKSDIGLELVELEHAALLVQDEEEGVNCDGITEGIKGLTTCEDENTEGLKGLNTCEDENSDGTSESESSDPDDSSESESDNDSEENEAPQNESDGKLAELASLKPSSL